MEKKVYVIIIKETHTLTSLYECYDSFKKAVEFIMSCVGNYPNRKLLKTDLKNEFEVTDENGGHIHTLQIVDLWVH